MIDDLNDTLVFVRVVQEGSFTGAARALQLPKTTVSRRVRALESRLGAQLLHRTTRRLGLTEAGALYFDNCRDLAQRLEDARNAVGQLHSGPRGWLRLTLPYSFGITWISPALAGFRARYPEVRVEIVASHAPLDLVKEELDLALRLGALPDSSLVARRLGAFPTGLYASPAYLRRHGSPRRPDDLRKHRIVTLHQARVARGYAWPLQRAGEEPRAFAVDPVLVASDPELLRDALRAGAGVSLAMHASMQADLDAGLLRRVLPEWTGPEQTLHAVFPPGRIVPPKVRAFVDYLKESLWS